MMAELGLPVGGLGEALPQWESVSVHYSGRTPVARSAAESVWLVERLEQRMSHKPAFVS